MTTLEKQTAEQQESECIHIVGYISGEECTVFTWAQKLIELEDKITFFNKTRKAVPHPGFAHRCKYCPMCGAAIAESQ